MIRWLSVLVLAVVALAAQAQDMRKVVVGFPPGGSADVIARLIADGIKADFGSVVVENKAGAGGRIALGAVKAAISGIKLRAKTK